jgi:hypothetical protein
MVKLNAKYFGITNVQQKADNPYFYIFADITTSKILRT